MASAKKNLPSVMCPTCRNYSHQVNSGTPHHCSRNQCMTDTGFLGRDPDKDGTANNCPKYESK